MYHWCVACKTHHHSAPIHQRVGLHIPRILCVVECGVQCKEASRTIMFLLSWDLPAFSSLCLLARYKVEVGGSPYEAVAYYHHAISLDSAKGKPVGMGGTWESWQKVLIDSKWMTWALTHACLGSFPKYMVCGFNVMKVPLLDNDESDLLPGTSSAFTLTVGRMATASNRTIPFVAQYTTRTWLRRLLNSSQGVMSLISMLL